LVTEINFFWNGRRLVGTEGDSVASALMRNGVWALGATRKRHLPLGLSGSYIAGVLARVDGCPNVRLDSQPLKQGMRVERQNCWPGPRLDLLSLARHLPAGLVRGGFEHGRLAPQRGLPYRIWERTLAWLAGVADPPDPLPVMPAPVAESVTVDLLVVGGGPTGIAAANAAAGRGLTVALATRGAALARFAHAMGGKHETLDPRVRLFAETDVCGAWRRGTLFVGAPFRQDAGAVLFRPREVVLAVGRQSIPPLVPGHWLPGVIEARTVAILSAETGVMAGRRVAVVGTGAAGAIAEHLRAHGARIVHEGPVAALRRIRGRSRVHAILLEDGRQIACDVFVHAGPWQSDLALQFQATADGDLQLEARPGTAPVTLTGSAAEGDEPISIPDPLDPSALVCPCMDVTAGEILDLISAGVTDPEEIKRQTSCGMGPCQGWPCWNHMTAVMAAQLGLSAGDLRRPSARAPRRGLTVAQAAGLWDVVEVER
jgi:bacterioferritin-associated ferredoxin